MGGRKRREGEREGGREREKERKKEGESEGKYQDLVDAEEANGFTMKVITLEVGSRDFLNFQGFKALFKH